jgi:hypothetical protein
VPAPIPVLRPAAYGTQPYGTGIYGAGAVEDVVPALPSYRSGMYLIRPRIYRADRDNVRSLDITAFVTDAAANADIDRSGPKSQLQISASRQDALPVYGWIAPYQEITPEVGDVITSQMGLYRLEQPRITVSGVGPPAAEATGWDVVTLLERAVLREAQTTPRGAVVMDEVKRAIEEATAVTLGTSLVDNGSFELDLAGWSTTITGSVTGDWGVSEGRWGGANPTPLAVDGSKFAVFSIMGNSGSTGVATIRRTTPEPIAPGTEHVRVSGWSFAAAATTRSLVVEWYDQAGTLIRTDTGATITASTSEAVWRHHRMTLDVPDLAASFRLAARIDVGAATGGWVDWDAFRVDVLALPGLSRFALPDDTRTAPAPIAHPAGTTWLARVNALLAAIGYHGIHATMDGRFTSRPLRDPANETPSRTYQVGMDSRLTGDMTIEQATGNVYNVVVVVKEDYQTKTSLEAYARNDDPAHPWSTVNIGERSPLNPIQVTDAVDGPSLQARADYELARSSMQESLAFAVLPDGALTVYDVIALAGTDGPAGGRWAVESLAWGLTANQPLVRVGARRTISPAWTEGQRSVDILIDTLIDVLNQVTAQKTLMDVLEGLLT